MKVLLFISLSLFFITTAYSRFTQGKARFQGAPEDRLSLIKEQLIYLAIRDMISQELEIMSFDHKLFWRSYEKALQERLKSARVALGKSYRVGDPKQTQKEKQEYQKVWRKRRLKITRNFSNLQEVLDSYKIGEFRRSSRNPMVRYIKMQGKINRSKLEKIYFQFAKSSILRSIDRLYWTFKIHLSEGSWGQLGISDGEKLQTALIELFLKKLREELGTSAPNVILTEASSFEKIQSHLRLDESSLALLAQERGEEGGDEGLANSVWAQMNLDITLSTEVEELAHKLMTFRGDCIVTELRYNKPIYLSQISSQTYHIVNSKARSLLSKVAQKLYQRMMAEWPPMKAHLTQLPENLNRVPIMVKGWEDYRELKVVRDILPRVAGRYQLKTYLNYFTLYEAQVIFEYIGQKSDLRKILALIHGQNLKNGKIISMDIQSDPLELRVDAPTLP